jgi:hypothetical protein
MAGSRRMAPADQHGPRLAARELAILRPGRCQSALGAGLSVRRGQRWRIAERVRLRELPRPIARRGRLEKVDLDRLATHLAGHGSVGDLHAELCDVEAGRSRAWELDLGEREPVLIAASGSGVRECSIRAKCGSAGRDASRSRLGRLAIVGQVRRQASGFSADRCSPGAA